MSVDAGAGDPPPLPPTHRLEESGIEDVVSGRWSGGCVGSEDCAGKGTAAAGNCALYIAEYRSASLGESSVVPTTL